MKRVCRVACIFAVLCLFAWSSSTAAELEFMYQQDGVNYYKTSDGRELAQHLAIGVLSNAPDYRWWYGCSPTSVGMIMGYYDRNGYGGECYTYLVPGGEAELSNYGTPGALANSTIASAQHIADYWPNPDAGSHSPNSLADFMGTSQDHSADPCGYPGLGGTWFYNWNSGAPFTPADVEANGLQNCDGMYGVAEYLQYRGYNYSSLFSQYINPYNTNGFTLTQYQTEINAGRPMVIQVSGHSMFGYGYSGSTVYVHDTWTQGAHTFTWGTSYSGRTHYGVMPLTVTDGDACGEEWDYCYKDTNWPVVQLQLNIEGNLIRGQAIADPIYSGFPAPIAGYIYNGRAMFAINYLGQLGFRFYEVSMATGAGTTWGILDSDSSYYDSGRRAQIVGCAAAADDPFGATGALDETYVDSADGEIDPVVASWSYCYYDTLWPGFPFEVNLEGARIRGQETGGIVDPLTGFQWGGRAFFAVGYDNDNLRFYEISGATLAGTGWAIRATDSSFYDPRHNIALNPCTASALEVEDGIGPEAD